MSLFNKKRSVVALGDEALDVIKAELDSLLKVAASYDQMMVSHGVAVISLEGRIRGDLLAFTLYLSGINRGVDLREIRTVNRLFDIDLSHVDFEIFRGDVSDGNFEHAVPPSVLLLHELGNEVEREASKNDTMREAIELVDRLGGPNLSSTLADDLINVYALIGSAFISANAQITERESADLVSYLHLMNDAVNGKGAPLPKGAAQRAEAAHKRLFGTKRRSLLF